MRALNWLLEQLFPVKCAVCGGVAAKGICESCLDKLPWVPEDACPHCGRGLNRCACSHMRGESFRRIAAPCYYGGGMRTGICALKFQGQRVHAGWIGHLMAEAVKKKLLEQGETIDLIVPAPLSVGRLSERGFNQSLLLAERVEQRLEIPLSDEVLVKGKETAIQHDLDYEMRRVNLHNAFLVRESNVGLVKDKRVLLIDDVATSGATLSECGKALYMAGAESVVCCVAAVSPLERGDAGPQENGI